jgi:hypothetical protein
MENLDSRIRGNDEKESICEKSNVKKRWGHYTSSGVMEYRNDFNAVLPDSFTLSCITPYPRWTEEFRNCNHLDLRSGKIQVIDFDFV